MPYIEEEKREPLRAAARVSTRDVGQPGDLNYLLTRCVVEYLKGFERIGYAQMSEVAGVLADVQDEFRRRVLHPYEDYKCETEGDVYDDLTWKVFDGIVESLGSGKVA